MSEGEYSAPAEDKAVTRRTDRVDTPQQYATWQEYAFSENPEEERKLHL